MRFRCMLIVSAIVAFTSVTNCGSSDCVKQLPAAVNQNGTSSAVLMVSACGGATVRHITDLKLTRLPASIFDGPGIVWTVTSWVDADLKWITPTQLEVSYPPESFKDEDIIIRTTRWHDIEIVYRPKTLDRTSPSQH